MKINRGFTLIELLVVVAIIGILATVVLASLGKARDNAKAASAQTTLGQIKTMITGLQINNNQRLGLITGSWETSQNCPTSTNLSSLAESHQCNADWKDAIDIIVTGYDTTATSGLNFYKDPWRSPYLLDENEGEIALNPCRRGTLTSAGADGIIATADDITIILPFERCS